VTVLAPMLYSTFTITRDEGGQPAAKGTFTGLMLASSATLAGLFAAFGGLAWIGGGRDGHGPWATPLGIALLIVSCLVAAYAVRTLVRLLTWSAGTEAHSHAERAWAVGNIVSVGCCDGFPARVTLNLL
jgi:hypothetical protein